MTSICLLSFCKVINVFIRFKKSLNQAWELLEDRPIFLIWPVWKTKDACCVCWLASLIHAREEGLVLNPCPPAPEPRHIPGGYASFSDGVLLVLPSCKEISLHTQGAGVISKTQQAFELELEVASTYTHTSLKMNSLFCTFLFFVLLLWDWSRICSHWALTFVHAGLRGERRALTWCPTSSGSLSVEQG